MRDTWYVTPEVFVQVQKLSVRAANNRADGNFDEALWVEGLRALGFPVEQMMGVAWELRMFEWSAS